MRAVDHLPLPQSLDLGLLRLRRWLRLQSSLFCPVAGTLPASWANMSQMLYLLLQNNLLSGSLPATWGQGGLTQLHNLNLSNNHVSPAVVHDLKQLSPFLGCLVYYVRRPM